MDRLGQLTLDKLSLDKMKNMVGEVRDTIAPRNDTEKRVYEALSNKNWGASSTLLNDIARDTYDFEKYGMILPLIWNALQSPSREWRKVFKSLSLLEHLVKNGAERVIEDARDNLHRVRMLSDFNYYEGPVDKGSGVREKSKQLIDLLKDNELIREEREKARKLRDKYVGLGSGGGYSGGGYSGGYGGSYSSGGGGYGGDRYGNGPSRYGDSSYSSGGGGYSDRGGGGYSDRGGGYSESADRDGFRGGYGYSDSRDGDKDKSKDKSKDTEKEQEPSSSSSSSSKPKRDRKKSSGPKLAIKIKDKDKDKSSSAETPAAPAPVPDLLGGDLFTTEPTPAPASIPAPATTGGQLGDLFSAPVAAAPAGASISNVGLDSFDPRAGKSTGTAAATTTGGFGHEFVGFAPASAPVPVPVTTPIPAFPVTGGVTAFGATADPFAATPAPVLSGGSSFPGVMNRTNSANNGAEEFSDFQSSGPTLTTTASSGETGSGGGMTNGGTASAPGGITNPKWRDVSSLVDLGGLSSNTDKKAAQQKQEEQTFQSNNNSFAGLDGFHTKPQVMGTARPTAGPTGLSGGVHGVGMMGGGMAFQQQHAMRGGLMGAHQGMAFPQQQQQQAFGTQGMAMGMGMGGMPGQQMGVSMGMGMGMQQGGGTMGSKRGMQAGATAGAGGAVMPGGFTGTGASGSFF